MTDQTQTLTLIGLLLLIAGLLALRWAVRASSFCKRCGKTMERRKYTRFWDRRTGRPITRTFTACPDYPDRYPDWLGDNECPPKPPAERD